MNLFLWNLLLAFFWAAVSNDLTLLTLVEGFTFGFLILWMTRRILGQTKYFKRVYLAVSFLFYFLNELVRSSLRVAHDIVTPEYRMNPGVIAIELEVKTDFEITFLANLISLTPGTLSLDVSQDRKILFIHAMYINKRDVDSFKSDIKSNLEKRVLELLR
jgi:multicomponent Na+:H+ antiporter subunit E